jgi:hypothetical protein
MFKAIGWDMENTSGYAEACKDVIQIDATVGQIDKLVYELYELTEDEINIVEKASER